MKECYMFPCGGFVCDVLVFKFNFNPRTKRDYHCATRLNAHNSLQTIDVQSRESVFFLLSSNLHNTLNINFYPTNFRSK